MFSHILSHTIRYGNIHSHVLAGEPKLVIDKVKAFTQKPSVLRPPAAILLLLMNNTHTHTHTHRRNPDGTGESQRHVRMRMMKSCVCEHDTLSVFECLLSVFNVNCMHQGSESNAISILCMYVLYMWKN